MNLAHIHLLFNHFPVIGFAVALGLFIVAVAGKNEALKHASLVIFFLIAVIAIPTYLSGNAAWETICPPPDHQCVTGTTEDAIRLHEDAALPAFLLMELTGFLAWLGLWQYRLISRVPKWNVPVVMVLAIVSFGLMARAANIGGDIRHVELANSVAPHPGFVRDIGSYVLAHTWVWPSCETLHFVGLSMLFTVVFMVDLRLLGLAKKVSFSAVYQLLPLGMLGFALNLITGMVFFIAAPQQYTKNPVFYWKVVFILLAGINVLYFMLLDEPWRVEAGEDAPLRAKLVAASAIFLWVGILFFGHMLPFLGNAF